MKIVTLRDISEDPRLSLLLLFVIIAGCIVVVIVIICWPEEAVLELSESVDEP